jgi:hypothetical protein
MEAIHFSTEGLRPQDQFEAWITLQSRFCRGDAVGCVVGVGSGAALG